MIKCYYFILLFAFPLSFNAQETVTISGYTYDVSSGESLTNVLVQFKGFNFTTQTNEYGFYSISVPANNYTIVWAKEAYYSESQSLALNKNIRQDIYLVSQGEISLKTLEAEAKFQNKLNESAIGLEKISITTLNKLPVLLGERDVLKSIKLTPGVKSSGAGDSGVSVRGGTTDQNAITLDDAVVYNADHLFGFFSTFNSDVIKDVSIYKGIAPANYGGRTSSFIDIRMKDGNNIQNEVNGGLGLIFSRLSVEGPLQKDVSSFLVSGRRSYADLFLKLSDEFDDNQLYFYDLNAKLNYKLSDKDQIFLSGYYGRDVLSIDDTFGINWGNITQTLRYNRIWNQKIFSNTSLVYSNFDFKVEIENTEPSFNILSKIEDFSLKHEFQYFPNVKNNWKFGVNATYHSNVPGGIDGLSQLSESIEARKAIESNLYINNEWKVLDKLFINYGVRLNYFKNLKGGEYYNFDDEMMIESHLKASDVDPYFNLEPRFSANYKLNEKQSIKIGYARNTQNLHLVANSITSTPSDRWIMSSNVVKPQISDQYSVGYFRNLNQKLEVSVEVYYKDLQNQIDYKNAADDRDLYIEQQLRYGIGRAYGIEFLLKKTQGKFTGWLGYTYSKTEKKINGVNHDQWYLAKQDRPHDLSLVGVYQLNKKWNFSASFIYQTGNAVTYPTGKYKIEEQTVWLYSERNGYRMPDNHRLDLSATWTLKKTKNRTSELVFSLYNAYARDNAFAIIFDTDDIDQNKIKATQISLFRIIPSVSYNFRF